MDETMLFAELGETGLRRHSGIIDEEPLQDLKGSKAIKIYKDMSLNDPIIGGILFAIEMLIRGVDWYVESYSDDRDEVIAKELVETALDDMTISFKDLIADILSFLVYGFSFFEIVYKKRTSENSKYNDGLIGWRKLASRAQDTLYRWEFDNAGNLLGMIQQSPITFKLIFIPIEKALLFRTTSKKENPEGKSILRNAYRPYYFKRHIESIEAVGVERDLAGLPIMYVPAEYLAHNADPQAKAMLEHFKKIIRNIRRDEQEGIILPSMYDEQGHQLFKIELLSSGGKRNFDTSTIISRYQQEIAMSVLADFILLGHEKVGSFALSSSKTELFAIAIGAWLDTIADTFNNVAIPRLIALNPLKPKNLPVLSHTDIETLDLQEISQFLTSLTNAGVELFPDDELENFLRRQAGLPEKKIEG
jgi:hypothetical protein